MDDCTVEGTRHRYAKPSASDGPSSPSGSARMPRAMSGKSMKVIPRISRCSFQCRRPAHASASDRRAP